ncbi:hypothetical protein [Algivirga pacifica]|uniref:Uncharacterized protein n=1 Tax=Algivirga pacifica TaxID=1162670 RepID=A0ABP9D544_9BACT
MKLRVYFFLLSSLLFLSQCDTTSTEEPFKGVNGTYNVDLSDAVDKLIEQQQGSTEQQVLAKSFIKIMIASIEVNVHFLEGDKCAMELDKNLVQMLEILSKDSIPLQITLDYKVEKDSILLLKPEKQETFEEVGSVTMIKGTPEDLLIRIDKNGYQFDLKLNKVKEEQEL